MRAHTHTHGLLIVCSVSLPPPPNINIHIYLHNIHISCLTIPCKSLNICAILYMSIKCNKIPTVSDYIDQNPTYTCKFMP